MLLATVITLAFYACGSSAEEKAAMEQARLDSIAAVEEAAQAMEQARLDSIAAAEEAAQAMEQARLDSIAAAEAAAAKKPASKKAPAAPKAGDGKDTPKVNPNVKAGQGKG